MRLIKCPECGTDVSGKAKFCPKCGHPIMEISEEVPKLRRWNWGAFWLTWIWAVGNKVWFGLLLIPLFLYISLLLPNIKELMEEGLWWIIFLPAIYMLLWLYIAVHGDKLAWEKTKVRSIAEFKKTQHKWAVAGFIIKPSIIGIFILVGVCAHLHNQYIAKVEQVIVDMRKLEGALTSYYQDNHCYPRNLHEITGQYIGNLPEDPFKPGSSYKYFYDEKNNFPTQWVLVSAYRDGKYQIDRYKLIFDIFGIDRYRFIFNKEVGFYVNDSNIFYWVSAGEITANKILRQAGDIFIAGHKNFKRVQTKEESLDLFEAKIGKIEIALNWDSWDDFIEEAHFSYKRIQKYIDGRLRGGLRNINLLSEKISNESDTLSVVLDLGFGSWYTAQQQYPEYPGLLPPPSILRPRPEPSEEKAISKGVWVKTKGQALLKGENIRIVIDHSNGWKERASSQWDALTKSIDMHIGQILGDLATAGIATKPIVETLIAEDWLPGEERVYMETTNIYGFKQSILEKQPGNKIEVIALIGKSQKEVVIPLLIDYLDGDEFELQITARNALEAITGKDFGTDRNRWMSWWKKQKNERARD